MVFKFIEIQGFKKIFFGKKGDWGAWVRGRRSFALGLRPGCNDRGIGAVRGDKSGIMKQSLSLLSAGVLLFFLGSCFKDPPPAPVTDIAGTWEIRSSQTGMSPGITYPPGNDSLYVFTNAAYSIQSMGRVVGTGTYQIIKDFMFSAPGASSGTVMDRIIYDDNTATVNKVFLQLAGDTLTFTSGYPAIDGGSISKFKRQ
jgi:hypothetical protein